MSAQPPSSAAADYEMHDVDGGGLADVYCPACGYHLRGVVGERCPECGYDLAGLRSTDSAIPWVHRRKRGRFRAYWRTVWMVTFCNRRFCEEYARVVDYRDARRFQWLTLLHVVLPLLLAATAVYYLTVPAWTGAEDPDAWLMAAYGPNPTFFDRAFVAGWPIAILMVSFLLFLAAATGVPSYFFHPRAIPIRRQNNGIALTYYTCGPLAWTGLLLLFVAAAVAISWHDAETILWRLAGGVGALSVVLILMLAWWINLVRLARRTMPPLRRRRAAIAIGMPLLWIILAGLIVIGLPAVILGILIVVASFS